jgi:hypothetical protein
MNANGALRGLLIVTAIPAGWTVGYAVGWRIGPAVAPFPGKGESYEEMLTLLLSGLVGAGLGAILAAGCAWHFTRPKDIEGVV